MAHVIAVLNPKGGTGKTTISTNLAGCLHKRGHSVLLVDSDPQGTALDWCAVQPDDADLPAVIGIDRPVLHKSIPQLTGDYAYIVIDGSAKIAENTTSAIRVADLVLIPVRHSGFDLWAVESLVEAIMTQQELRGKPAAAFLISAQVKRSRLAKSVDEALAELNLPVLAGRTSRRVAYESAGGLGLTVMDLAGQSAVAAEIESITDEILELLQ